VCRCQQLLLMLLPLLLLLPLCCRRYLYSQTAKWLRAGAGDYKVDALYVWTAGERKAHKHFSWQAPHVTCPINAYVCCKLLQLADCC
jgi:hypothetical protein